jgi:molecular chaperone DnaJ
VAGQDWFEKDFYAILGVGTNADDASIKKAYRKLARRHHPDASSGDEARFKEVGEAYSVLSDAKQRQQYDAIRTMSRGGPRFAPGGGAGGGFEDLLGGLFSGAPGGAGANGPRAGGPRMRFTGGPGGAGGPGGVDLDELLRGMGGGAGGGFGGYDPYGGPPAPRGPRRGADVDAAARLGFREAVMGGTVTVRMPDASSVTARVPVGVRDGQRIRLRGKGAPGGAGAPDGDLLITVTVEPDPVFGRREHDLTVTVPVTFAESALGATVEVPTLEPDGALTTVRVKVPAGTPSGRTLRVRGRGIRHGKGVGDLRVSVQVVVPQRLSAEARAAVEDYARATAGQDPRAELLHAARDPRAGAAGAPGAGD